MFNLIPQPKLSRVVLLSLTTLFATVALTVNTPRSAVEPAPSAIPAAPSAPLISPMLAARLAPLAAARPEPQPIPTAPSTAINLVAQAAPPAGHAAPLGQLVTGGGLALLGLAAILATAAARRRASSPSSRARRQPLAARSLGVCVLAVLVGACGQAATPVPTQPPAEYLSNALDWLQANSVKGHSLDWAALRQEALARAPHAATAADTYPALRYATGQLGDWLTFFSDPEQAKLQGNYGLNVLYPENLVVDLTPGGSAERAGLRLGDTLALVDGALPRQWQKTSLVDLNTDARHSPKQISVRRAGVAQPISVTLTVDPQSREHAPSGRRLSAGAGSAGYIELPLTNGAQTAYPTTAQHVLRDADQPAACGWIVDLRRNYGGDIWSYLAAIGPVLGQGELGGFIYPDGKHESWAYHDGKVYWNGNERMESTVEGPIFQPRHPLAPVAVLTSRETAGAGELALIAFRGRPAVRTFGEPTSGSPFLQTATSLSDGAFLSVSGAFGADRNGHTYDGPLAPDETIATDWTLFGGSQDPVIGAAQHWLAGQPGCAQ